MTDVLTTVWGFVKQTIGGNRNTWGGILNANFDLVEAGLAGAQTKAVLGGSVTLTNAERRNRIIIFTGTLTSNQTVILANVAGAWTMRNSTSGAFTLSLKTADGTAVELPQGEASTVWCDGSNGFYVGPHTDRQFRAPSGTLALPGISLKDEIASGFRRVSAGIMAWVIAGVDRITVSATAYAVALAETGIITYAINGVTKATLNATSLALTVPLTVNGAQIVPIGASTAFDGITAPTGWLFKYGQAVSRTTYSDLFAVLTATANATRNNTTGLSALSVDLTGLGLEGSVIEGTGIPSSTTIVSMTATTITLSQAATGSGTMAIRILPHGAGDGSTTFNIPDSRGRAEVGRDNMGATSANRLTGLSGGLDGDKLGTTGGAESHTLTLAQSPAHTHVATVTDPGHTHVQSANGTAGGVTAVAAGAYQAPTPLASSVTASSTTGISVSNASQGGDGAHNNVQPSRVTNKIIYTGVFA